MYKMLLFFSLILCLLPQRKKSDYIYLYSLKTANLQLISYMIKRVFKQITNYLSASCIVLLCFSCGNKTNLNKDHLVFRYNEHANIRSLDPAFSRTLQDIWITNQLFNGLVQMDDSLNIVPCIAKDWTVSMDGITYTFSLRNDVYFHKNELFGKDSTRIVVAEDFRYSLNRLRDPKVASPGSWV